MSDLLPVLASLDLPEKPSDFDGWNADDVIRWVNTVTPHFTLIQRAEEARLAIGLALWKLRGELGEGDYGRELDRLAAEAKVHSSTLRRWLKLAEERFPIGPPPKAGKRVEAAKKREAAKAAKKNSARNEHSSAIEVTGKPVPNKSLLEGMDEPPTPAVAPVASGPSTVPDPAPGGNGAAAQSGGPPAEPGGGVASTPQEPSAPTEGFTDEDAPDEEELRRRHDALARSRLSGGDAPAPEPKREPPSPAELVAALLRFKPDRLAGVDGPSLRSLLALVRGALEAQAAKAKPDLLRGGGCPHPPKKRKQLGYITLCGDCGQKL